MVKNRPANAGNTGDVGSIPGSGRSPGEGNGNPLQYSCLENLVNEEPGGLPPIAFQQSNTTEVTASMYANFQTKHEKEANVLLANQVTEMEFLSPLCWHMQESRDRYHVSWLSRVSYCDSRMDHNGVTVASFLMP